MKVVDKKPVPIYETTCPECKSRIEYKASEVSFSGYITCPVCGMSTWASVIKPVRYEDGCETNMNIEAEPVVHCIDRITDEVAQKIIEEANKACTNCQEWVCDECEYKRWRSRG